MHKWVLRSFVALVTIFLLMPVVTVIVSSFASSAVMVFPPSSFTFRWYRNIPPEFLAAGKVSLIASLGTAILTTLVGVPTALALVRGNLPGKTLVSAFCMLPLTVPTMVFAVAAFQFATAIWHLTGADLANTYQGLILGQSAITLPFVIRAVVAAQANFDRTLEEASLSLGASPIVTFFRITLPLLTPAILSGAIFSFLMSFDDVPVALFLASGRVTTLPVKIFTSIEFSLDAWIMAVASMIILASLALMVVLDRTLGFDRFFGTKLH
jgi:putative spermidine/putrescine transport system permease protein